MANDTNGCRSDVFVRDMLLQTNILVGVGTNGFAGAGSGFGPGVAPGFPSSLPSVPMAVTWPFPAMPPNIVAHDKPIRLKTYFCVTCRRGPILSVSASTTGGFGNGRSFAPVVSADGRFVMFRSFAQNLTTNSLPSFLPNQIYFQRDICCCTQIMR